MSLVLDTHAVIWYFLGSNQLSVAGLEAIRRSVRGGQRLYISAISIVEMIYLIERGRIPREALTRLDVASKNPDSGVIVVPLDAAIAEAVEKIPRDIVPDMPDRIIAATAVHLDVPCVTRDSQIRLAGLKSIW
ncbi:MAG TPA: type II toxin-antitoxin system VapC family toxin [Candidatus Angelobacter sp.]|jgi:PIN domain nuclease of toxin-antitoxin system|nr:type II toxin-antitoxin system VapC family toxin [Candidatus Angelobacter sp.]